MLPRSLAELSDLLSLLKSGQFAGNRYALIHEFGEAGFEAAEQTIASHLSDPDPELRFIALSVLVLHWGKKEYRSTAERMIRDLDPDVRRMAVCALGVLAEDTRDARALALLLQRIDDLAEEWHVRDEAHDAIIRTLGRRRRGVRFEPTQWPHGADADALAHARVVAGDAGPASRGQCD